MKGFRVTAEEIMDEIQQERPIFYIDARTNTDWNLSDVKIKGAVRIPTDKLPQRLDQVPRGQTIITY